MSDQLYNLTPVQMGAATALMGIGLLAACLLTMGQWLIHRRRLATVFLLSVGILLAFYTWAFATVFIHSQTGIFLLKDRNVGWFVVVCLVLGAATMGPNYRYAEVPLLVTLTPAMPPFVTAGGVWVLLTSGALTTSWLCVQVWRDWQLLHSELSPFSVKGALDRLEHGVTFANFRGRSKLPTLRWKGFWGVWG